MQAAGIAAILPLWRDAVRAVPFGGEDLVLADYGAALDPARPDKEALMDALFKRYAARLAAAPRRHEHYVFVVLLTKNPG